MLGLELIRRPDDSLYPVVPGRNASLATLKLLLRRLRRQVVGIRGFKCLIVAGKKPSAGEPQDGKENDEGAKPAEQDHGGDADENYFNRPLDCVPCRSQVLVYAVSLLIR